MLIEKEQTISVLIPCYNSVNTIEQCLDSVLKQDYPHLEILWCDDGSTDGSYEKIIKLKESKKIPYLRVIKNKQNQGISATRNLLVNEYIGNAFIFIDADDTFASSTSITTLFNESRNLTLDVVVGKHKMVYPKGDTTTNLLKWWWNRGNKYCTSFYDLSKRSNMIFWWNILFSREFQKRHSELIPQNIRGSTMDEELYLLVLLATAKTFKSINTITYIYQYSKNSTCFHKNISEEKFSSSLDNLRISTFLFKKYRDDISIENQKCFYCWLYFLNDIYYYRLRSSSNIDRSLSKKLFKQHKQIVKSCFSHRIIFFKWWKIVVYFYMTFRKMFWI